VAEQGFWLKNTIRRKADGDFSAKIHFNLAVGRPDGFTLLKPGLWAFLQLVVVDLTGTISWPASVRLGQGGLATAGAAFIMCIMLNSFGLV
jgi:hypothetical protein